MTIAIAPDAPGPAKLDGPSKLVGYAARFNVESELLQDDQIAQGRPFVERIEPGAFAATIGDGHDIPGVFAHDMTRVIGRTSAGTLRLSEDAIGLAFACDLAETTEARDLAIQIGRGDYSGCSFLGYVEDSEIIEREGLPPVHVIRKVSLAEVTLATAMPAYLDTMVAVRSGRHRVHRQGRLDVHPVYAAMVEIMGWGR